MRSSVNRLTLCICIFLTAACFVSRAEGQDGGRIGIFADAQFLPQAGVTWHVTDRIQARGGAYFGGDRAIIADLAVLYRWRLDGELGTYVGPNLTLNDRSQEVSFGILAGTDAALHSRMRLFGEIGLSYGNGGLNMWNTGVGVVFYLNQ